MEFLKKTAMRPQARISGGNHIDPFSTRAKAPLQKDPAAKAAMEIGIGERIATCKYALEKVQRKKTIMKSKVSTPCPPRHRGSNRILERNRNAFNQEFSKTRIILKFRGNERREVLMPCGYAASMERIGNPAGFQLSYTRLDNASSIIHIPTRLMTIKSLTKIKNGKKSKDGSGINYWTTNVAVSMARLEQKKEFYFEGIQAWHGSTNRAYGQMRACF